MAENMFCLDHKDNRKYRKNYDNIFRKKKKKLKKEVNKI